MGARIAATSEGLCIWKFNLTFDQETEQIKLSAQTSRAQAPHPFEPAQWTHPNGHPRCRVCGSEETLDGKCPGLKAEPVRFGPGAAGSAKVAATSEGLCVFKFNPYHDQTGRFAQVSGVSVSSVSIGIGTSSFKVRPPLSNDEHDAVEYYAGEGHVDLNKGLRANAVTREQSDLTVQLDHAISKSSTKQDLIAYRGIHKNYKLKPGSLVVDHGFVSTSLSRDTAEKFGSNVFQVHIPRGSSALLRTEGAYGDEREVLLGRDAVFRVMDKRTLQFVGYTNA